MSVFGKWMLKTGGPGRVPRTSSIGHFRTSDQSSLPALQLVLYGPKQIPSFFQWHDEFPSQLKEGRCAFEVGELSKFSTPQCWKFFTKVEGDKLMEGRSKKVMADFSLLWEQFPHEPQNNRCPRDFTAAKHFH